MDKQEILQAIKPKDVLNYYGIEVKGDKFRCPFHNDTNPSSTIKGDLLRCWVCQYKSINVIDFVMQIENIEFNQAIKFIANAFNLDLNVPDIDFKNRNKLKQVAEITQEIKKLKNLEGFPDLDHRQIKVDILKLEAKKESLYSSIPNSFIEKELEKCRV